MYKGALTGCKNLLELSFPASVQNIPLKLSEVPNREIKLDSIYSSFITDKAAKGVVVYLPKESIIASKVTSKGATVKYFDKIDTTIPEMTKIPDGVVSGCGKADTSWYHKSKKEYEIKNPDQMAGLSVLVSKGNDFEGKTINLTNDIDLSCYPNWIAIGGYTSPTAVSFNGNFDGNEHTIYNLRIHNTDEDYQGLFGVTEGVLENLTISDAYVYAKNSVGILTGTTYRGTIHNCHVSGIVSGNEEVGGLLGKSSMSNIDLSTADVNVSGICRVGGLQGYSFSVNTKDCTSNGKVFAYEQVGGLIGALSGGFDGISYAGSITNCINRVEVSGDIDVGGIVGNGVVGISVTDCSNENNITGNENVGGIFGRTAEYTKNCINRATISGRYHVGGIAGYLSAGTISDCTNQGNVSGVYRVSGVLGAVNYYSSAKEKEHVFDCKSTGVVSGVQDAGSVIGKKDSKRQGSYYLE